MRINFRLKKSLSRATTRRSVWRLRRRCWRGRGRTWTATRCPSTTSLPTGATAWPSTSSYIATSKIAKFWLWSENSWIGKAQKVLHPEIFSNPKIDVFSQKSFNLRRAPLWSGANLLASFWCFPPHLNQRNFSFIFELSFIDFSYKYASDLQLLVFTTKLFGNCLCRGENWGRKIWLQATPLPKQPIKTV